MSSSFDLSNPNRKIHVGVLLPDSPVELLDVAPVDIFYSLSSEMLSSMPPQIIPEGMSGKAIDSQIHWISEDDCHALDVLYLGAAAPTYTWSEAEKEFIRQVSGSASAVISVCGGMQSILEAGVLQGKTATAPRLLLPILHQMAPGTNWVDRRWARDGNVWTSGALLNGIDLVAAFARQTWGQGDRKEFIEWALELGGWNVGRNVEY